MKKRGEPRRASVVQPPFAGVIKEGVGPCKCGGMVQRILREGWCVGVACDGCGKSFSER